MKGCDFMVKALKIKHMNIYTDFKDNAYVIHNTRHDFNDAHTHIKNLSTAKYIAHLAVYKKLPKKGHLSEYLIISLIRISDDNNYIRQLNELRDKLYHKNAA
jgi:hypothetical protein